MVTTHKNFKLVRGDTLRFSFSISDINGDPDSITGAKFTCKKNIDDDTYLFQKTLNSGITLIESGKYTVRISPSDTKDLPIQKYYYDLEIIIDNDIYTLLIGQIDLIPDVTRQGEHQGDDGGSSDDDPDDPDGGQGTNSGVLKIYFEETNSGMIRLKYNESALFNIVNNGFESAPVVVFMYDAFGMVKPYFMAYLKDVDSTGSYIGRLLPNNEYVERISISYEAIPANNCCFALFDMLTNGIMFFFMNDGSAYLYTYGG